MERVMGVGGIFFRATDKAALGAWYRDKLGVPLEADWGGAVFDWRANNPSGDAHTVWSPFEADTDYFGPTRPQFMVNFRVANLEAMLTQLRAAGCEVDDKEEHSDFGHFGWVTDSEGNRIELWQPQKPE
jgi:predicted enzyme related to lactoylglutathione lyase